MNSASITNEKVRRFRASAFVKDADDANASGINGPDAPRPRREPEKTSDTFVSSDDVLTPAQNYNRLYRCREQQPVRLFRVGKHSEVQDLQTFPRPAPPPPARVIAARKEEAAAANSFDLDATQRTESILSAAPIAFTLFWPSLSWVRAPAAPLAAKANSWKPTTPPTHETPNFFEQQPTSEPNPWEDALGFTNLSRPLPRVPAIDDSFRRDVSRLAEMAPYPDGEPGIDAYRALKPSTSHRRRFQNGRKRILRKLRNIFFWPLRTAFALIFDRLKR